MVRFRSNGADADGYFAAPDAGGKGVVVIQEYWGLVPHIKSLCDRLAKAGFAALAPDLYHGRQTTDPDEAGKMMMALDIAEAEKTLAGATRFLLDQRQTTSECAGVVGFCMGGALALLAATTNPEICASADFYGIHPNVKPQYKDLGGPVLGIFAEHDSYAGPQAVAALNRELEAAEAPHEFFTYPGTHHAFFNDARPEVYDAAAANDAWTKLTEFFEVHVR